MQLVETKKTPNKQKNKKKKKKDRTVKGWGYIGLRTMPSTGETEKRGGDCFVKESRDPKAIETLEKVETNHQTRTVKLARGAKKELKRG